MTKKSDKFDRKIRNKVPIFKEDLEFEIFHAKNLQQIDNDKLNFQKEYFNKVSKELSVIDKKERVSFLEKMISFSPPLLTWKEKGMEVLCVNVGFCVASGFV